MPETTKIQSVAILGRGALGVMYGDFLSSRIPEGVVYFLADEKRCERYRAQTLTANGNPCSLFFKSPKDIKKAPDLLIVALKGPALQSALQSIKALISENSIVISVMNGISSEDIIEEELGTHRIVHCVAQRMDALFQNGVLTYKNFGELVIGLSPAHKDKAQVLDDVVDFFDRTEMPYVVDYNILHRMWCKWMLNVGVNQTLAVYNDVFRRVHQEGEARETLKAAMREVLALSQKEGTGLTNKDFRDYLQIIDELNPDGMPSMRQDRLAKRLTEVDLFAGTVIRKAEKYGLPVPVNRRLYAEIKSFEDAY